MARILSQFYIFMLFHWTCFPKTTPDRRFSDLKRCADDECSMLLCRGKATKDFSGPDCRFLSFKKGETVYVYYKLSGQRSDVWAGSVGSSFGYFPKDFLDVNHIYSEKEIEVPSEETDFVCFDTGLDTFESYDVDLLLSNSLLLREDKISEKSMEITQSKHSGISADDEVKSRNESTKNHKEMSQTGDVLATSSKNFKDIEQSEHVFTSAEDTELHLERESKDTPESTIMDSEQFHKGGKADITDDAEASNLIVLEPTEPETATDKESAIVEMHQKNTQNENSDPEQTLTKDIKSEKIDTDHVSQVEAIPELKTILGTTFDAVTTDDVNTQKVTPYYDEINSLVDKKSEHEDEDLKELPLLSFEKELPNFEDNSSSLFESRGAEIPKGSAVETQKDDMKTSDKSKDDNIWPSVGDIVSKIEDGGEELDQPDDLVAEDEEKAVDEGSGDTGTDEFESASEDELEVYNSEAPNEKAASDYYADSITEESISSSSKYIEEHEQDTRISKPKNQTIVGEHNKEFKLSRMSSDLDTLNDVIVESEDEAPTSIPEKQVLEKKKDTEIVVQKETTITESKTRGSLKYEEDSKEGSSASQLDHGTRKQLDDKNDIYYFKTKNMLSEVEEFSEVGEDNGDIEELLEDENALLSTNAGVTDKSEEEKELVVNSKTETKLENSKLLHEQTTEEQTKGSVLSSLDHTSHHEKKYKHNVDVGDETQQDPVPSDKPEYSDSVQRLTILREHFDDDEMKRIQTYLSLKELFRVEAMFSDLEQELKSVRESQLEPGDDMERTLESILEVSENAILNEIEKMLDAREQRDQEIGQEIDPVMFDKETAILDDFQELAFYLRQKYSTVSDSVPLVEESQYIFETGNMNTSAQVEDSLTNITVAKASETPEVHKETDLSKADIDKSHSEDIGIEEDGGHFNKNKDVQAGFKDTEDVQRGPQAILENPADMAFTLKIDPSSDLLESTKTSDFYDSKADYNQVSTSDHFWRLLTVGLELLGIYTEIMIGALPEKWQPGPTFHGLPWRPVVATAAIGLFTVLIGIWRHVFTFKAKLYLSNEKELAKRSQQLASEISEVLLKVTESTNMIKDLEETVKTSEKSICSVQQEDEKLKTHCQMLHNQMENLSTNISHLSQGISDMHAQNNSLTEKRVTMQEKIGKFQTILKVCDEERIKICVPTDDAKIREDALKTEVLSLEKNNNALKRNQKSFLHDEKDWQERHGKLREEITFFCKTHKEIEENLVHKENEIDVLSKCVADLKGFEACDSTEQQKGNAKLSNGEALDKKSWQIKSHLKQIMDVSRIKASVSVIEDERNRFWENVLAEQQARQECEERFQQLTRDETNLRNERTRLESQYKNIKQRLEITTELHQQKENTLQQKLTQEELERREKETKLSEVDDKALQAEEELNSLKQKVKDTQEEMQQSERVLKTEIALQEKKAHENSLKAHDLQRTLIEERRESVLLHEKIVEYKCTIADLKHALYKSCPADRHIPPRRRGDSYGSSPVNGGVPSPPPLIVEGSEGSFLSSQVRDSHNPALNDSPMAYSPLYMSESLASNGLRAQLIRPPNGHQLKGPPGFPLGPDPRFSGPISHLFASGRPVKNIAPGRPPASLVDFPPDFDGPCNLPLTSQPPGPVSYNSQGQGREHPGNSSSNRWPSPAGDCKGHDQH